MWLTYASFLFFTGLVALITWLMSKGEDVSSNDGFFLAGRSLTFPFIAASLLLTNLSTEQMVGLNGDAFTAGLSVMVWEVVAVVALVVMALFFLPKFLKSGIATVPQFLEIRFGSSAQVICNVLFMIAYMFQLLPIILYTGGVGLAGILDMKALTGIQNDTTLMWCMVWLVGIIGSIYALFGGLRSIAISDLLNGIGLLTGGLMITWFGLRAVGLAGGGASSVIVGINTLASSVPERINSIGGPDAPVKFWEIFSGVMLINMFYWCTNQQIIQRTLAASTLREGQKGVLLTGLLKLIGPLYLVLPGIMAYYLYHKGVFGGGELKSVDAYGTLVRTVLPKPLTGFFAAVMVGAVLSSFNSALNSTCTLFSLGIYKKLIKRDATDKQVVASGKYFGYFIAISSMTVAPLLMKTQSIFTYLQTINGIYFIPIFAVVLIGLLSRRAPSITAPIGLVSGVFLIIVGYFVLPSFPALDIVKSIGKYHFLGVVFILLLLEMYIIRRLAPRSEDWVQSYSGDVDITPWKGAWPCGLALILAVVLIYATFADFSVLKG